MNYEGLDISFEAVDADGTLMVRATVKRRSDGYTCSELGLTDADALLRASLAMRNRECQEFNRAEHDHEKADKNDLHKSSSERYRARRMSPMAIVSTDTLMDINLFYSQMQITAKNFLRTVTDFAPIDDRIRKIERPIPFMTETEEEKAQKPRRKNG